MSVDQFWVIRHISQIVYQNKIKFYREILDIRKYILGNYHIKLSSGTYYFIGSKLQDKSYQICHTRPCVLFGTYLELQVEFFSDSCWSENNLETSQFAFWHKQERIWTKTIMYSGSKSLNHTLYKIWAHLAIICYSNQHRD